MVQGLEYVFCIMLNRVVGSLLERQTLFVDCALFSIRRAIKRENVSLVWCSRIVLGTNLIGYSVHMKILINVYVVEYWKINFWSLYITFTYFTFIILLVGINIYLSIYE